ncbi:MAG: hypothetical protein ACOX5G_05595 [Kiritimatiellia bacterium]
MDLLLCLLALVSGAASLCGGVAAAGCMPSGGIAPAAAFAAGLAPAVLAASSVRVSRRTEALALCVLHIVLAGILPFASGSAGLAAATLVLDGVVAGASGIFLAHVALGCPSGRGGFTLAGAPRVATIAAWMALGAAAGWVAGGMLAAPAGGFRAVSRVAGGCSGLAALLSLPLAAGVSKLQDSAPPVAPGRVVLLPAFPGMLLLGVLAAVGLGAWNRIFRVVLGAQAWTSVQLAAVVLVAAALGLLAGARRARNSVTPLAVAALCTASGGLFLLLPLAWISSTIELGLWPKAADAFGRVLAFRWMAMATAVAPAAFLLGHAAATLLEATARRIPGWAPGDDPPRWLYGMWGVSLGLGGWAGALLLPQLTPRLGVVGLLRAGAVLGAVSLSIPLVFLHRRPAQDKRRMVLDVALPGAGMAAALLAGILWRAPDVPLLSDGVFSRSLRAGRAIRGPNGPIRFHSDGAKRAVSVAGFPDGTLELDLDGKPEMNSAGDLPNQLLVAHVPLLLHPHAERVAVVGLGSSVAAGAAAAYPVKKVECVDDEPAVLEAARLFGSVNAEVFDDPRVEVACGDVRRFLLDRPGRYDVVISQPSNPWLAGMEFRFTREYFDAARGSLGPDGIFCGWIEGYGMDFGSFRRVVATFLDVFPNAMLWCGQPCEYLVVGSMEPFSVPADRLLAHFEWPDVSRSLSVLGIRSLPDFASAFVADTDGLRGLAGDARPLTDATTPLAFAAARSMRDPATPARAMEGVEAHRAKRATWLSLGRMDPAVFAALDDRITRYLAARGEATAARHVAFFTNREQGFARARAGARLNPDDAFLLRMADDITQEGRWAMANKDYALASLRYSELLDLQTNSVIAHLGSGAADKHLGRKESAYWHFIRAVAIDPIRLDSRLALAGAAWEVGDVAESIRQYRYALELDPESIPALHNLAVLLGHADESLRDPEEAVALATRACELEGWANDRLVTTLVNLCNEFGRPMDALQARERFREAQRRSH